MSNYQQLKEDLKSNPKSWLVTGAAGFIGSHLVQTLLELNQKVVGLDNFATGFQHNLDEVQANAGEAWSNFTFLQGDIRNLDDCQKACAGADIVLHQAALGSVPRSIKDPLATHAANVDGFINMLVAARDNSVGRLVFASSSSVYGDSQELPKVESRIGKQLSPYALSKRIDELYATNFADVYGISCIGLRYFNVFGARQDANGAYAAVIPIWMKALLTGEVCKINGDGETSRDFCFVDNAVQANLLAGCAENPDAANKFYNIAFGERTTLNELYSLLKKELSEQGGRVIEAEPEYRDFRAGDVRHSLANIDLAREYLSYEPEFSVRDGISRAVSWFLQQNY